MADTIHDLVFDKTRLVGTPTPLVFGETEVIADVSVEIAATLGGVTVAAFAALWVDAAIGATLGGVTVNAAAAYDNRVTPWRDNRVASDWHPGIEERGWLVHPWQLSAEKRDRTALPLSTANPAERFVEASHGLAFRQNNAHEMGYDTALGAQYESDAVHQKAIPITLERTNGYGLGELRARFTDHSNQAGIFNEHVRQLLWEVSRLSQLNFQNPIGKGVEHKAIEFSDHPWKLAGNARPGLSQWPPVVVVPPTPVSPWSSHLRFQCSPLLSMPAYLRFGGVTPCDPDAEPSQTLYILPARFYMTAHTVVAHRMPDEELVPIFDATVSADAGSYCWTLSASGPAELYDLLAPVGRFPAQLRVTLDGIPFLFAVSVNYSGGFAKSQVSITGRSVTSLIAAPYLRASTRTNAEARTAQQLAVEALSGSGVGLDWGLVDWLIPTGAWNHQGTPLEALQAITQSAGGYLQSHRSEAVLSVRHPYAPRPGNYPGAPWEWMTGPADVELAPDSIITEGLERQDGGDINAVYVSGTTQGVLALVKRAGSAGDKLASMVTDQLLTNATAARQRGLSILGPAGPYSIQRFELPVLTGAGQPGVLDVGQLVQVNEPVPWRGRVRSVSVGYKRPTLRQTITLERHPEAV